MQLRELKSASADAFAIRAGVNIDAPHPLAETVGRLRLSDLAAKFGEAWSAETGTPLRPSFNAVAAGLSTSDFGAAMGDGLRQMMLRQFNILADHRQICAPLEVKDFREVALDFLEIDGTLLPVGENGEIQAQHQATVVQTGAGASLSSFARLLKISRRVIVNDHWGMLQRAFTQLGAASSRLENRMVFHALEANPTLSDSEPLFHADLGNVVTAGLGEAGLAVAMAALRKQKTPNGEETNNRAAYLCVSPAEEFAARKLIHENGLDMNVLTSVNIISSPNLEAGRWYLMADPLVAPVVARLHLPGAANQPFRLEPVRKPPNTDGLALKLTSDLGVSVISRIGIVRGGSL